MTDDDWAPEFEPVAMVATGDEAPRDRMPRLSRGAMVGLATVSVLVAGMTVVVVGDRDDDAATPATSSQPPPPAVPSATTVGAGAVPSVVELLVDSPAVPDGVEGSWVDWSIEAPGALGDLDQAVDVALLAADGLLHLVEFPSGNVRSTRIGDTTSEARLAAGGGAVAVARSGGLVVLTGESIAEPPIDPAELPRVVDRGGTGEFVVFGGRRSANAPERQWIVDAGGGLTEITGGAFSELDPWEPRFLAGGELVAAGPAGVVAVDTDGGTRLLGPGRLVGAGTRHVAVRRCGPSGECRYVLVDAATTTETPASLGELDPYRFWDTSVRISPDGRFAQYADWRRDDPSWRLVDLGTGSATDLAPLGAMRIADAWAPDGSGVFLIDGDRLVFHSIDGSVAAIAGLGAIRSVATQS